MPTQNHVFSPPKKLSSLVTDHWSQVSFTFSAKERDTETGLSYFGSRYYSSDLSIWLSVDPMAAKYPGLSPFTYCANNPVKLVDPNGEQWETPEDEKKANSLITKAQNQHRTNNVSIQNIMKKNKLTNNDKKNLDDLIHQNNYLSEGIANLENISGDKTETYHFNNVPEIENGCSQKRQDGVIDIIHSSDAMAWHECVHIGDYRQDKSQWGFDNNGFLGTEVNNYATSEYKAYESQFSFNNNSINYSNGLKVQGIRQVKQWVIFHKYDVPME